MLISFLLQLHLERKEKPPKCQVASLGITVHAEFSFSVKCFILMHLWQWKAKWMLTVIRFRRVSVCYPFVACSFPRRMVCLSIPKKLHPFERFGYPLKKISICLNALPFHSKNLVSAQRISASMRMVKTSIRRIFVFVRKLNMSIPKVAASLRTI